MRTLNRPELPQAGISPSDIIPDGWTVAPLKRFFRVAGGATPTSDPENWDGDIPWVTPGDLSGLDNFFIGKGKRSITERGYKSCGTELVPVGSVILSTRAPIGSLAIAQERLCTNQGCKALVPTTTVDARFFAYALSVATPQLNALGQGSTFRELSGESLGSFRLPVPSPQEQCRIAAFLDHETARIDELVREQERLLTLISEHRKSLIASAIDAGPGITKARWPKVKLAWFASIGSGTSQKVDGGGVPLFGANGVIGQTDVATYRRPGVLVGRVGTAGAVTYAEGEYGATDNVLVVVPNASLNSRFLYYSLGVLDFTSYISETAQPLLTGSALKAQYLTLPPVKEQLRIVAHLDSQTTSLDALSHETRKGIALLLERRSALICAAVTGQLDLRDWQSPEPQEATAEVA